MHCQALSSCVTLGGSRGSTNQARTMPCERGESIQSSSASGSEAVLTCRFLWVPLQFPSLSQLSRSSETLLSRTLTVSCFSLRGLQWPGFSVYFSSFRTPSSFQKTRPREKYLRYKVLKMQWLKTNGRELLFYYSVCLVPGQTHCSCSLCFTLLPFLLDYFF